MSAHLRRSKMGQILYIESLRIYLYCDHCAECFLIPITLQMCPHSICYGKNSLCYNLLMVGNIIY